jgi:transcription initiation factor TFIIIB Brf1 subunit/transcription initiation factor TFIIB
MNYCKQCGENLEDGILFCPNCGCKIGEKIFQEQTKQKLVTSKKKINVCSILAIIFGAIGVIPLLNFLFLPAAIILAIIGWGLSKNRKKGTTIASTIVVSLSLVISFVWVLPAFSPSEIPNGNGEDPASPSTPKIEKVSYKEIFKGEKIETDFVLITIDEVAITSTLSSINSSVVLNASQGEEYVYIKGTITNKTSFSYELGALGQYSYSSNVDTRIDSELVMSNGEKEYGSLLIDDGGIYGIISDGRIAAQETVTYYFAFTVNKSQRTYYKNGEIFFAFVEDFKEEPNFNHTNCDYLYKIKLK